MPLAVALPVRLRLTLWYSVLLAAALVLFAASVYVLMTRSLLGNLDTSLHQRVNHLVWQSLRPVNESLHSLLLLMLALGPGLLLLAGFGGMLLARRAFRPVTQITQTASSISATDLQRRVPVGKTHDELNELAVTFNAMIERLESAVARERRFTADASHELRSPLAVILAEASLALEEPLSPEDYRHVLGVVQEQAKGMHEMIAALLTLARVEVIQGPREPVAITAVIERTRRQCAPVMAERRRRSD